MLTVQDHNHRIDWASLADDLQLELARQALLRAAEIIAGQAECLAREIEDGALADEGGPDALRLLAAVIRATNRLDPGQTSSGNDQPGAFRH